MPDVAIDIKASTGGTEKAPRDMASALKEMDRAAQDSGTSCKSLWGQVALGAAAWDLTKRAAQGAIDVIKGSIQGAIDRENSEKALTSALEITGRTVEGNKSHYDDFATAQKNATLYTRDQIEAAQTLLLQLTNLDQNGVDRATKGAMGLATVMGIDLESATRLVTKAMEGNYTALARIGIKVDQNLPPQEKQAALLAQLDKLYGRATAATETFGGQLIQDKKAVDEAGVSLGKLIIEGLTPLAKAAGSAAQLILGLIDAEDQLSKSTKTADDRNVEYGNRLAGAAMQIDGLKTKYGALAYSAREYSQAQYDDIEMMSHGTKSYAEMKAELDKSGASYTINTALLKKYIEQAGYGAAIHEILAKTARPVPAAINEIGDASGKASTKLAELKKEFKIETIDDFKKQLADADLALKTFGASMPKDEAQALKDKITVLKNEIGIFDGTLAKLPPNFRDMNRVLKDAADEFKDGQTFAYEYEKVLDSLGRNTTVQLKAKLKDLLQQEKDLSTEDARARMTALEYAKAMEDLEKKIRALTSGEKENIPTTQQMEGAFEKAFNKIKQDAAQCMQAFDGVFSAAFAARSQEIDNLETQEKASLDSTYQAQVAAINASTADQATKDQELKDLATKYAADTKAIDDQIARDKRKLAHDEAAAHKVTAITSATINMAEAITKAFTAGPLVGQILAGITAALCAAEIAIIAASPLPALATGGSVQETGAAVVHQGEVVLNAGQVDAISRGQSGAQTIRLYQTINIGGNKLQKIVTDIVQTGFDNKGFRVKSAVVQ